MPRFQFTRNALNEKQRTQQAVLRLGWAACDVSSWLEISFLDQQVQLIFKMTTHRAASQLARALHHLFQLTSVPLPSGHTCSPQPQEQNCSFPSVKTALPTRVLASFTAPHATPARLTLAHPQAPPIPQQSHAFIYHSWHPPIWYFITFIHRSYFIISLCKPWTSIPAAC